MIGFTQISPLGKICFAITIQNLLALCIAIFLNNSNSPVGHFFSFSGTLPITRIEFFSFWNCFLDILESIVVIYEIKNHSSSRVLFVVSFCNLSEKVSLDNNSHLYLSMNSFSICPLISLLTLSSVSWSREENTLITLSLYRNQFSQNSFASLSSSVGFVIVIYYQLQGRCHSCLNTSGMYENTVLIVPVPNVSPYQSPEHYSI